MSSLPTSFKETIWWKQLPDGSIVCTLCPRNCKFEKDGSVGACGVRVRLNNKIYLAIYGKSSGWALDPIEKKPLFHFYPGSCAFSIGTIGCNLFCRFCQNWFISQSRLTPGSLKLPIRMDDLSPENAVALTRRSKCTSIAYTYNEPIVWYEYMVDTAKLARKYGIKNVMVTNGYINEEPLIELAKYMDAANVDLKGDKNFYERLTGTFKAPETIMSTIEIMKERGMHVEVTILVIPGWNDKEELFRFVAKWMLDKFGPEEVPVHISRFYPNYMMRSTSPTPVETLIKARKILMEEGIKYVYLGNVPGHPGEHTYCPNCGKLVIKREGFLLTKWNLDEHNRCKFCGHQINIRGTYKPEKSWIGFHMFF